MGLCIGDACDFVFGSEAPSAQRKPKTLRLESGDVYLFGVESRLMWHGISRGASVDLHSMPFNRAMYSDVSGGKRQAGCSRASRLETGSV